MLRFGLLIAAVVFVLDQVTKLWVLNGLKLSPAGCLEAGIGCGRIELSGLFDLTMVWNRGVSFGMLHADGLIGRWALSLLSIVIAGFFASWLRTATRPLTAWALGLVIGGALGNVVDRVRFGAVVDFLDFSADGRFFPWVFNVADSGITVGAALLALDFVLAGEAEKTKSSPG